MDGNPDKAYYLRLVAELAQRPSAASDEQIVSEESVDIYQGTGPKRKLLGTIDTDDAGQVLLLTVRLKHDNLAWTYKVPIMSMWLALADALEADGHDVAGREVR